MYLETLVGRSLGGHNWGIADEWVVDARIGNQVGLEFVQVNVQCTIESEAGSDGRDDLRNEAVQVLVVWSRNVQIATADIINGLIVNQEGTVSMLDGAVGGENGVVWLDNGGGDLWGRIDSKLELALLSVVNRESLEEESTEARASPTAERVEDQEAL